ncbi:hypothetical protein AVEN_126030-1, partial [Araneus ventricosus]
MSEAVTDYDQMGYISHEINPESQHLQKWGPFAIEDLFILVSSMAEMQLSVPFLDDKNIE